MVAEDGIGPQALILPDSFVDVGAKPYFFIRGTPGVMRGEDRVTVRWTTAAESPRSRLAWEATRSSLAHGERPSRQGADRRSPG